MPVLELKNLKNQKKKVCFSESGRSLTAGRYVVRTFCLLDLLSTGPFLVDLLLPSLSREIGEERAKKK